MLRAILLILITILTSSCSNLNPSGAPTSGGGLVKTVTVSIIYNSNAADATGNVPIDTNSYSENQTANILGNTGPIVRSGYRFIKWNTEADGTGHDYHTGDSLVISSKDVLLYAQWIPVYQVIYNANGGTGAVPIDSGGYAEGEPASIIGPGASLTNVGSEFVSWKDGSGDTYTVGQSVTVGTSNIELYAQWELSQVSFSVAAGSYCLKQTLTMTAAAGSTIHYTLDASTPTCDSLLYSGALTLTSNQTVSAIACESTESSSTPFSANYQISNYTLCGDSAANNCYDNATAVSARVACLPDGTQIDLVPASGSLNVWQRHLAPNYILQASGQGGGITSQTDWQRALNSNGNGFSGTYLTSVSNLAGRACPHQKTLRAVHIDNSSNLMATGYCLYYDNGNPAQALNKDATSQPYGLVAPNIASWYEGNIKTCADKGMRLPTLFETTVTAGAGVDFTTSALPQSEYSCTGNFCSAENDGVGVPSSGAGYSWTSTTYNGTVYYSTWSGTYFCPATSTTGLCAGTPTVRCVLP